MNLGQALWKLVQQFDEKIIFLLNWANFQP